MAEKTWQPNEKQKLFIKTLEGVSEPLTLADASEIAGVKFASGTINILTTKEIITAEDTILDCDIVLHGTNKIVGHTKKKIKMYSLVRKD